LSSNLTGLTPGTIFYVRACAANISGTACGNEISFTTKGLGDLAIGDSYQGGSIANILQSGDPGYDANVTHGIIAANINQSLRAELGI
jgi:hypothetical protein